MSLRLYRALVSTTAALIILTALPAGAGPTGGTVVGGSATIQGAGTGTVTINQSSPNAVINWTTFNIGKGETTTFNQLNSSSIALNRVIGGQGPSFLNGTLTANGKVFIINGDGILFGPHSVINTAGFLATTNDIRDSDFMAGRYNFNIPGRPSASIVNLGKITATSGGFAALVAPGVRNSGTITATLGTVSLAAGNAFTLDFYGDKLITLALNDQIASKVIDVATGRQLKSLVSNDGRISADGGRVELSAAAARKVVDSVINNKGVIEANSIGSRSGMIVLGAASGARKPAGAPTQTVKLSGRISAAGKDKGTTGGTVVVTGENIVLKGAQIDVSGDAGGGKVLIGGDTGGGKLNPAAAAIELARLESFAIPTATTVSVDATSVINASATGQGSGGKVIVWSDQQTTFAGTILAGGGGAGGDGGFVETSSHGQLNFSGIVDLSAPRGATGTLLLDPFNVTICQSDCGQNISNSGGVFSPTGSPSFLQADTLEAALANANVLVTTGGANSPGTEAGNITVNANVTWSNNNSLTLSAFNSIIFQSTATISNTGAGNLLLRADNSGRGTGTVSFFGAHAINYAGSTGTVSIYYNPINGYASPTDFSSHVVTNSSVPNQLTAYMLVNNSNDVSNISQNLAGTYALGKSIDATGFAGFQSGTTFAGLLDGNGGLGVSYAISNLTLSSSQSQNAVGLFPFIGSSGSVRNLILSNVNISAGANIQNIGALAGENDGSISNVVVASGTISGGSFIGIGAGGLVGQNKGSISGVTTAVTVSVGNSNSASALNIAGGIVASNLGAIGSSIATGNVSGGTFSWAGGLAGQNGLSGQGGAAGTITSSYALGKVSVSGLSSLAGGLVGNQAEGSGILNSQAFGNASSSANGQQASDFNYVGGLIGRNLGTVGGSATPSLASACVPGAAFSCAAGAVSVGSLGWAGGLIGQNQGTAGNVLATGAVTGGANSVLGGLVGGSDVGAIVLSSKASGAVTSTGANSVVGGLIGANGGLVQSASASGPVTGTSTSYLGGLIGINLGLVQNSSTTATASVTGNGSQDVAGGFAGLNLGSIDPSSSAGNVTAGSNSIVGGFVGVNAAFNNFQPGQVLGSFPVGTISSDSAATGTASGGAGSIVGVQVGQNFATPGLPAFPSAGTICGNGFCGLLGSGIFADLNNTINVILPAQTQIINNLIGVFTLAAYPPGDVVNTQALNNPPQPPQPPGRSGGGPAPPGGGPAPPFGGRFFVVPPPGAPTVKDEVILQIPSNIPSARIAAILRGLGLTILDQQTIGLLGLTTYRVHIDNGSPIASVIRSLAAFQVFVGAQANYIFRVAQNPAQNPTQNPSQDLAQDPDLAGRAQEGDAAQYALGKLGVIDAHRLLKGTNVTIAIIDSAIDVHHPDLDGVIAEQYDAVGKEENPHPHGTGMAGAIAAHRRLMGIAPSARLYAVHAFSSGTASAESTTFSILKGLDWAASKGVRVINMSFAGPRDPSMERALKTAHDRGIVLIAAAGNAGPKSPPLYPGADPSVIAVTATDIDDKVFSGANRGRYIAVAAPGVDILVPATDAGYQLTTGTSVACAEVSGVAALLIERNPNLTPEDIRKILTSSAKRLGSKDRDDDYGSGLVDLSKAIQAAGDIKPITPAKR